MKIKNRNMSISSVVVCYSIFMALMLFQTSYMKLGTITAFITMLLTILAFFSKKKYRESIKINATNSLLLVFLLLSAVITFINFDSLSYKYVFQILLCVLLFSVDLNEREQKYLKRVFIISSVVYGALTIYSCYKLGGERYLHGGIILFNTSLDPNFIGLPINCCDDAFVL